jgi:hypothetical protein
MRINMMRPAFSATDSGRNADSHELRQTFPRTLPARAFKNELQAVFNKVL